MSEQMPWPAGFRVGHWTEPVAGTGCTVIVPPAGTLAAVDIRGGGPGTRETELLAPQAPMSEISALLLSGGSAFGLSAAAGVVEWCEQQHIGYDVGIARIPIVPTAVIFDLGITGNLRRPGPEDAFRACQVLAEGPPEVGSVGAGTGATIGKLFGQDGWCKGGLGVAATRALDGTLVAVLVVVNAFGDILDESGGILAGAWRAPEGFVDARRAGSTVAPGHPRLAGNTTLAVVMTDGQISKPEATQVARMASAGVARVIAPVHTPMDGDVTFALASGQRPTTAFTVGVVAALLIENAIRGAIRAARSIGNVPTAQERRAGALGR
jgi:L-aminopeptidase/D-esterase-like protein